jgi:hypothetical protein
MPEALVSSTLGSQQRLYTSVQSRATDASSVMTQHKNSNYFQMHHEAISPSARVRMDNAGGSRVAVCRSASRLFDLTVRNFEKKYQVIYSKELHSNTSNMFHACLSTEACIAAKYPNNKHTNIS